MVKPRLSLIKLMVDLTTVCLCSKTAKKHRQRSYLFLASNNCLKVSRTQINPIYIIQVKNPHSI